MSRPPVRFGKRVIGGGAPPLFLPDIDLFFNQDLDLARRTIERLVEAGVEMIKGAVLHRAEVALDDDTEATWFDGTKQVSESYRALIARKVVSLEETARLFEIVRGAGLDFVLSVYDAEGAAFAAEIGSSAIKIPSSNVTHEYLIGKAAQLGLPLVIDTGKSNLEEIAHAVSWAREAGCADLVVEHSPLAPPAPVSGHDLRMLATIETAFDVPTGLSDHHRGNEMLVAATALGAALLEKGVVDDAARPDQDVHHAIRLSEVPGVLAQIRNVHEALGQPMRTLARDRTKPVDRMGLVAARDLAAGDTIGEGTADFAFPARGIPAENWSTVAGWRVRTPRDRGLPIRWSDVEPLDSD